MNPIKTLGEEVGREVSRLRQFDCRHQGLNHYFFIEWIAILNRYSERDATETGQRG